MEIAALISLTPRVREFHTKPRKMSKTEDTAMGVPKLRSICVAAAACARLDTLSYKSENNKPEVQK